jgi:hypothetical protein
MLTTMTEADWTIVLRVFQASRSRRGDKGRDDRKFHKAPALFRASQHHLAGASGTACGNGSGGRAGTFEAFFDALATMSETAHLVQMFDSTMVRARMLMRRLMPCARPRQWWQSHTVRSSGQPSAGG